MCKWQSGEMCCKVLSKFRNLLSCHPPFISWKREGACDKKLIITKYDNLPNELNTLLQEIVDGYKSTACKPPCQRYVFETDKLYQTTYDDYKDPVRIVFSRKVTITKTYFLMSIPGFLTGLGGAVSGGRTLMWLLVTLQGCSTIVSKLKQYLMYLKK